MYKLVLHTGSYRSETHESFSFKTRADLGRLIKKSKLEKLSGEIILRDNTKLVFNNVDSEALIELYDIHTSNR